MSAHAPELAETLRRLADLVEKYRMLEQLRAGAPGRTVERRDAIRAVAGRFPAAMREWDEASPSEITRRREEVERVLGLLAADGDGGLAALAAPERAWILYSAEIHERLRAALRIKRWLAGRAVTDELAAEAARIFAVDRAQLARIATPERGRFTDDVYAEVARAHGVTVDEIKGFLFPGQEDEEDS